MLRCSHNCSVNREWFVGVAVWRIEPLLLLGRYGHATLQANPTKRGKLNTQFTRSVNTAYAKLRFPSRKEVEYKRGPKVMKRQRVTIQKLLTQGPKASRKPTKPSVGTASCNLGSN